MASWGGFDRGAKVGETVTDAAPNGKGLKVEVVDAGPSTG